MTVKQCNKTRLNNKTKLMSKYETSHPAVDLLVSMKPNRSVSGSTPDPVSDPELSSSLRFFWAGLNILLTKKICFFLWLHMCHTLFVYLEVESLMNRWISLETLLLPTWRPFSCNSCSNGDVSNSNIKKSFIHWKHNVLVRRRPRCLAHAVWAHIISSIGRVFYLKAIHISYFHLSLLHNPTRGKQPKLLKYILHINTCT